MDLRDKLEIYIPGEAEVMSIPLRSLPNSVLRRMGVPLVDFNGSKKLTNSPKGIWICPAVIQRKGQKSTSHTEKMLSFLDREFRATPGPFRMLFVVSNPTAYKVLKDIVPGNKVSPHLCCTSSLPQGLASRTYQTAVVVYAGQIYLSIRRPSRSQGPRDTHEPQSASCSSALSTARLSSKSQKKELPNDNEPKKKLTRCKVTHGENKKGVRRKVRDVSSSKTARSVPQSTDGVHRVDRHCDKDARGEQSTEEAAVQETDWAQSQEEVANNESSECEIQDRASGEAQSTLQNSDLDSNLQSDGSEAGQSGTHSWMRREPLGAACASTSIQNDFDFKELAQDELIARTKARLRQNEAAPHNFPST
ncbi:hypothetical protein EXN66_Car012090 [Channa argus]|uniref:Uncharacterized protein n=1 Tax=Channa argus TaxID=215402 RepID=A0A6G1Q1N3_CHAAH|nr:hypothetical protein EXN66_Car012090 [Channa argus]KAK2898102.1 hypothetical protein Q8A73_014482 [Channa argus]